MQWYKFDANDVWMFRDNKPFNAAESFVARSVFPPNPQVMTGMLRSHILERSGVDWQVYADGGAPTELLEAIGGPGSQDIGALTINGPYIAHRASNGNIQRFIPQPLDLIVEGDNSEEARTAVLQPQKSTHFITEPPFDDWQPLMLPERVVTSKADRGWLSDVQFAAYLAGETVTQITPTSALFQVEEHTGLALERGRKTAREHMLYRAQFIRPAQNVGLLTAVSDGLLPDAGVIATGGEARFAHFTAVDYAPPQTSLPSGFVKVVLLTPAFFDGGAGPSDEDWTPWMGPDARLVAAAIGDPLLISGWDIVRRRPKPLRRYVPAGSVYYFENAAPTQRPFTQSPPDTNVNQMGFGMVAYGAWTY